MDNLHTGELVVSVILMFSFHINQVKIKIYWLNYRHYRPCRPGGQLTYWWAGRISHFDLFTWTKWKEKFMFAIRYLKVTKMFFKWIVMSGEKWILYNNVKWKTNIDHAKWTVTNCTKCQKIISCVWWYWKVNINHETLSKSQTIDSNKYCSHIK